jgi:hypothetical protein
MSCSKAFQKHHSSLLKMAVQVSMGQPSSLFAPCLGLLVAIGAQEAQVLSPVVVVDAVDMIEMECQGRAHPFRNATSAANVVCSATQYPLSESRPPYAEGAVLNKYLFISESDLLSDSPNIFGRLLGFAPTPRSAGKVSGADAQGSDTRIEVSVVSACWPETECTQDLNHGLALQNDGRQAFKVIFRSHVGTSK